MPHSGGKICVPYSLTTKRSRASAAVIVLMTMGFVESVGIWTEPTTSANDVRAMGLPVDSAVRPYPTAPWRELQREHAFKLPRYPDGPFAPVHVHAWVVIKPGMEALFEEKTFGDAVLSPRYSVSSTFQHVFKSIRDVFRR
jgi:hypothetical protein